MCKEYSEMNYWDEFYLQTRTRRVHTSANFRICSTFTLGFENFDEIALSLTVKEISKHFCVFAFLAKIRNFKMAAIFENVLKMF